ncbi:uroporphyrinogen-III C-methyltransferase [Desulfovibrio litoralis]|uniref:uroporphyrinogen-III C-methyltransferase n=1 Tax=Desulfovibrio litoralis DSM 11393 TaxID=1121455 RepID=A0A1M7TDM0_9BACT|nr:uroporphyrinogen-III C-methyltransferase [Desulfovibrio litoralis]SHN68761.1 uroporphyrinogen-III synthase /uroporphyrinogen-III C-methyltransferase [Desulfovibrio litoralis DSM 11393]
MQNNVIGKVYLIGAGPGDPGLLTLKAKHILENADVIVYDYLANEFFLSFAKLDAELIYVGKKGGDHTLTQDKINELIVNKAKEGKVVARLKGGDPYIFGRGGEEAEELLEAGVSFEEIPGISSTIGGPAYAGIPLTHRDYSSSVCLITGHEDANKTDSVHNWKALVDSANTLVFVMGMKNLPDISRKLIDAGMDKNMPAALVRWGTTARQRTLVSTIANIPEDAVKQGFAAPCVIIVGNVIKLREKLNWFEKRPLFGKSVVVTRAREQASGLAHSLTELGAEVIQFPTIEITRLADYSAVHNAINKLDSYDWVVFTSVNGVKHFWHELRSLGKDARAFKNARLAAIGPATADALIEKGLVPDFVPESYVAEGVVEGLTKLGMGNKKILIPRALVAREVLPEELIKAGATVEILPVYETKPGAAKKEAVLKAIENKELDCITFGSSSTVDNFFSLVSPELLKKHPEIKLASIGPITGKTLEKYGVQVAIEGKEFTIPALVEAIVAYYANSK